MAHTRAGLRTRKTPREPSWCGLKSTCGATYGRIRQGSVLRINWSTLTDVLKRPKFYFQDYIRALFILYIIHYNARVTLYFILHNQMPSKTKPLPLHVNRALIERERANVIIRTQRRIALLRATDELPNDEDPVPTRIVNSHCCLNKFCFCVALVTMNLLFLQWLNYEVRNSNQL